MFQPHIASNIEVEDRIAQYDLEPSDVQEHVYAGRSYYFPVVVVHSYDGIDTERLRAEILMSVTAATDRFFSLPEETQRLDKKSLDDVEEYIRRVNENS